MDVELLRPEEIEKRSFEIITKELEEAAQGGPVTWECYDSDQMAVVKRCIHTTADFDYAETLRFSADAVNTFKELVRKKAMIVTDTNMALSGINKKELAYYGCEAVCFMADPGVSKEAMERGMTRASVSMERAMASGKEVIFVIGNAPTALITLKKYFDEGKYVPAFVIGVPVGFVNVVAAKEMILKSDLAYIVNEGRKGGSNVAAAIVNAMLYMMRDEK